MKLSALCSGTGINEWFPIAFKGKQSGQLHLKSTWKPATAPGAAAKGSANAAAAVNQYAMGMAGGFMAP